MHVFNSNQYFMKILKCDLCDHEAKGETFEEWMNALMPHYMESHAEKMNNPDHTAEDKNRWMVENKARFDAIYIALKP
jgi:hypothetical protein